MYPSINNLTWVSQNNIPLSDVYYAIKTTENDKEKSIANSCVILKKDSNGLVTYAVHKLNYIKDNKELIKDLKDKNIKVLTKKELEHLYSTALAKGQKTIPKEEESDVDSEIAPGVRKKEIESPISIETLRDSHNITNIPLLSGTPDFIPLLSATPDFSSYPSDIFGFPTPQISKKSINEGTQISNLILQGKTDEAEALIQKGINLDDLDENGSTALISAIESNNLSLIKLLIEKGSNINKPDIKGNTPLHNAVIWNSLEIVNLLIKLGADLNKSNIEGNTAINMAAERGKLDLVKAFILAKADINLSNSFHMSPIMSGAVFGFYEIVKELINAGSIFKTKNELGETPLTKAIAYNHEEIVKLLIDSGANIDDDTTPLNAAIFKNNLSEVQSFLSSIFGAELWNAVEKEDSAGITPLHMAIFKGNLDIVKLLEKKHVYIKKETFGNGGMTPIFRAVMNENTEIVKVLIASHADVNTPKLDGETPLISAIEKDSLDIVKALIQAKAKVNAQNSSGETPLHVAAKKGNLEIVKLLIANKADLNAQDNYGFTPLHRAIYEGQLETMEALLSVGANPNTAENTGITPLIEAVIGGKIDIVKSLIGFTEEGIVNPYKVYLTKPDNEGNTTLHIAAKYNRLAILKILIKTGKFYNFENDEGNTPLYEAVKVGNLQIVEALIDAGADVNCPTNEVNTPLFQAVTSRNLKIVKALIQAKADLNLVNKKGQSLLYTAIAEDNKEMVDLLIQAGVNIEEGTAPLNLAIYKNDHDSIKKLLKNKRNINKVDPSGITPLHMAIFKDSVDIVKLLIRNQAVVDLPSFNGITPLARAAYQGSLEIVDLLIAAGADINLSDERDYSPPHWAVGEGHLKIVNALIEAGADVNQPDDRGLSPLHYAVIKKHLNIAKALVKAKANINQIDNLGGTPFIHAVQEDNLRMAKFLAQAGADINIPSKSGATPWEFYKSKVLLSSKDKFEWELFIKELAKIDKNFMEEIFLTKLLANVWGLQGETVIKDKNAKDFAVKLEGFAQEFTLKNLSDSLNEYISKNLINIFPAEDMKDLKEAFEFAYQAPYNTHEVVNRIKLGKPVFLSVSAEKHNIAIVFYKDKLMVCNRGYGRTLNTTEIYSLPKEQVTEEIIEFFKNITEIESVQEKIQQLNLKHIDAIKQKHQGSGNCGWASPKAALYAILYAQTNDKELARTIYKNFSFRERFRLLEFYNKEIAKPNSELLAKIGEKIRKKYSPVKLIKNRILTADKDTVLKAVEKQGLLLKNATPKLQDDEEVVITAIKNNFNALEYASDRLKVKLRLYE